MDSIKIYPILDLPTNKVRHVAIEQAENDLFAAASINCPMDELPALIKELQAVYDQENKIDMVPFEAFWTLYPRKDAGKPAEKVWNKLKPDDELFAKIKSHLKLAYIGKERQYIPLPTTYLNQERWNDESSIGFKDEPLETNSMDNRFA